MALVLIFFFLFFDPFHASEIKYITEYLSFLKCILFVWDAVVICKPLFSAKAILFFFGLFTFLDFCPFFPFMILELFYNVFAAV